MMVKCLVFAAAILVFVHSALAAAPVSSCNPFPSGYGYDIDPEVLKKAVEHGDQAVIRKHGWSLWAGIMQAGPCNPAWPLWFSWNNTTAAFKPPEDSGHESAADANKTRGASIIALRRSLQSKLAGNGGAFPPIDVPAVPVYPIPGNVAAKYPRATQDCVPPGALYAICDGKHFQSNGDIMIPTESLSDDEFAFIRQEGLFEQSTLVAKHAEGIHDLVPKSPEQARRLILTKHMYWPVRQDGPTAIPVWTGQTDAPKLGEYYAGYETWPEIVAVDPSGKTVGKTAEVGFLYGINYPDPTNPTAPAAPWPTKFVAAKVYPLDDFYHHKVTQEDWDSFDDNDKAIIEAAAYWAYGRPFQVGDYLVTIAMHINTREIASWALQSVWWSNRSDDGPYAKDRPSLPQAKGPWTHYLLTDAYGIPDKKTGRQPIAMNPYIELVIHPQETNCNNCHNRAGWPTGTVAGTAGYQNPDCPDPLATLSPQSACLRPLTLTDFQWIIPDRAK